MPQAATYDYCTTPFTLVTLPAIDESILLKCTHSPLCIAEIPIRHPTKPDCLPEHLLDTDVETSRLIYRETSHWSVRQYPRPIQRLAPIDIANPRDQSLFEEEFTDYPELLLSEDQPEAFQGKLRYECVYPERPDALQLLHVLGRHHFHPTEFA